MEKKTIKIVFNGTILMKKKLCVDKNLSDVREEIKDRVQQKFYFYDTENVMIDVNIFFYKVFVFFFLFFLLLLFLFSFLCSSGLSV